MLSDSGPLLSSGAPGGSHAYANPREIELELRDVVAGLQRRKYLLAAAVAMGLIAGLVMPFFTSKTYNATATVEYTQPANRPLGLDDPSLGSSDLSTVELLNTELKTQVSEITDDSTALAVVDKLHLDHEAPFAIPAHLKADDPLNRERGLPLAEAPHQRERLINLFRSRLHVDVVKGTRLLDITFTDSDPERAANVANAVVAASVDETAGRHFRAYAQVSSWLTDQLTFLKQRVEDSQKRAEAYENENQKDLAGMTLAAGGGERSNFAPSVVAESVPVSRLLALNNQLTNAQVARITKEAIYRAAASGDMDAVLSLGNSSLVAGQGVDSALAPAGGGLALLQHLREQQVQTSLQIANAAGKYGAKSPTMIDLRRQQAALDAQIRSELAHLRERARTDLELATRAESNLREQVTAQQADVSQWTTKADHLLLLQGEAASSRALYQNLYARLEESEFAAGMRAAHVAVLDPARVPMNPSSPNRKIDLMLGLLVGGVLGVVAALASELLDDSLHSAEDVRKVMGVSVLGSIPKPPRGFDQGKAWIAAAPKSPIAEAYRSFRTAVFGEPSSQASRVLLLASTKPAQGREITCLNTAAALAAQGKPVVIVDADMRRRSSRELLFGSSKTGLSEYLVGQADLDDVLRPAHEIPNLSVLPAGSLPDNPSELLSSGRFHELMQELRARYAYVVVDSPPALLFSDTRILSAHADAYVFVVQASRTLKRDLRRALDGMYGTGATFLGVLMNGCKAKPLTYAKFGYEA